MRSIILFLFATFPSTSRKIFQLLPIARHKLCPTASGYCVSYLRADYPGDSRSWESPQTLLALFIGPFEHVERFRNLKFAVKRITHIQSTVLSSSEGTAAIHLAFK